MLKSKVLPGTLEHQKIFHSILSYYENDPRIVAITVFGSRGRGKLTAGQVQLKNEHVNMICKIKLR